MKFGHPFLSLAVCAALLAGCDEEEVQDTEIPIRAIKYMTIGGTASAERRIFAGLVEAGTSSNVAFELECPH